MDGQQIQDIADRVIAALKFQVSSNASTLAQKSQADVRRYQDLQDQDSDSADATADATGEATAPASESVDAQLQSGDNEDRMKAVGRTMMTTRRSHDPARKDQVFDTLRREILAARLKVTLDEQLERQTSPTVKRLAEMKLPPIVRLENVGSENVQQQA